jgi:D-alanyl-lipoteichoic acid acyltransferase DltB (MBOAT superfamily)
MLFNSHVFILLFLPITLCGFYALGHAGRSNWARLWLVAASLFFYGWWDVRYVPLLVGSVVINQAIGRGLGGGIKGEGARRGLLWLGVTANLATLGWFKYANFLVDEANRSLGAGITIPAIVLPLAISFFTFQQIAYLVDAWRTRKEERDPLDYAIFVTFFPQLIAGPIVHHREMIPQFARDETYRLSRMNVQVGLTIFAIGLFKKVVIADGIALQATPIFRAVELGATPDAFAAWTAALAYTLQLYFDFSGYSDMAIGLGRLFGVKLPLNFHSPYQATSIIEFWRRWHITLSRFLRDYLYIPLGGNRRGRGRRYANLMVTMLLGGLWHGAGWTFVAWGGLHGLYLLIAHVFRAAMTRVGLSGRFGFLGRGLGCGTTFLAVVVAWVVFRAESLGSAWTILSGMMGRYGVLWPEDWMRPFTQLALLLALVWWAPNTQSIMGRFDPALLAPGLELEAPYWLQWRPSRAFAVALAIITIWGVLGINRYSEFLYFQF